MKWCFMNKHSSTCRGAAIVEFVIVVPLLLLMVFGITELGRGLYQSNTLIKGIESGVRYMTRANGAVVLDKVANTCTAVSGSWGAAETLAKNVVVYGRETAGTDQDKIIPGLETSMVTIDSPRYESITSTGGEIEACVIRISVAGAPFSSPILHFLKIGDITFSAEHEERYIGE